MIAALAPNPAFFYLLPGVEALKTSLSSDFAKFKSPESLSSSKPAAHPLPASSGSFYCIPNPGSSPKPMKSKPVLAGGGCWIGSEGIMAPKRSLVF